jgi:hypothetical protein
MKEAVAGEVADPVLTVRNPAALREARRRKAEKAFQAEAAGAAAEVGQWEDEGDSWNRPFWTDPPETEPEAAGEDKGSAKVFSVEFKHNAAVILDTGIYDPDAY